MKINSITGSRAEFFLLKDLILKIEKDKYFQHKLIVTGSHNQKYFGKTINQIKKNKINIGKKIKINLSKDDPYHITKSFNEAVKKFNFYFLKNKPDAIMLLGDRYEIFSAAIAAYFNGIPIIHLYGGELTYGAIDESIRHCITKLANIHFVSNRNHFLRVRQLGENKKMIFNVGSLGVEAAKNNVSFSKKKMEKDLKIKFRNKNLLVTFHSETLKSEKINLKYLNELLKSLSTQKKTSIIFTLPNADFYFKKIIKVLKQFVSFKSNCYLFSSLGHDYYFSLCKIVDLVIGNSSSGIIEVPTLKKISINIGERQLGRISANSVINTYFDSKKISLSIKKAYKKYNTIKNSEFINPYEGYKTSNKIINILKRIKLKDINYKKFYDLK